MFSMDEISWVGDVTNALVEESLRIVLKPEIWYGHSGLGWYPADEFELERECLLERLENWFLVGEGTGEGIEHVEEDAWPRFKDDLSLLIDLLEGTGAGVLGVALETEESFWAKCGVIESAMSWWNTLLTITDGRRFGKLRVVLKAWCSVIPV